MVAPQDVAMDLLDHVAKKRYPRTQRLAHGLHRLLTLPRWSGSDGEERLVADFNASLDAAVDKSLVREVKYILGLDDSEVSRTKSLTARRRMKYGEGSGSAHIAYDTRTLVRFLEQLFELGASPVEPSATIEGFAPQEVFATYYDQVGPLDEAIGLPTLFATPDHLVLDMHVSGVIHRGTRVLTIPLALPQFLPGPWFPEVRRQSSGETLRSHPAGKFPVDFARDELEQMVVVGLHEHVSDGELLTVDLRFTYSSFEQTGLILPRQNRLRWVACGTERRVSLHLIEDAQMSGPVWGFVHTQTADASSQPIEISHHEFGDGCFISHDAAVEHPPVGSVVNLEWSRRAEGPSTG